MLWEMRSKRGPERTARAGLLKPPAPESSVWRGLPAVVREGPVGFGHLVGVFPLLDRRPPVRGGVQKLAGELLGHGVFAPVAGGGDDPADSEGLGGVRAG